jgi:hypothetical protein
MSPFGNQPHPSISDWGLANASKGQWDGKEGLSLPPEAPVIEIIHRYVVENLAWRGSPVALSWKLAVNLAVTPRRTLLR